MMTAKEFEKLSLDLRKLAKSIPPNWGQVQNNRSDDKINMFSIDSYEDLKKQIEQLSEPEKNYLRRRWYLWRCSECDEFLFYINNNVEQNPNRYDKAWDVRFSSSIAFDIKGTVIPRNMRNRVEYLIDNPQEMIRFYYEEQSRGRRFDIQNRLFIVHHSFVDPHRELYLRCAWESKRKIYRIFSENIDIIQFFEYNNVLSAVIFILEREAGVVSYKICGLDARNP